MKFNEALLKINAVVLKDYPLAQFYEAQGFLVPTENVGCNVDGTIDTARFRVAYNYYDENKKQKTLIGTFNEDGTVNVQVVNDVWVEDIIMTPYVSMECADAIEILCKKYGSDVVKSGPVTLRHQLFPGEAEPRYFFGSLGRIHTVNVYTGKIDVPAGDNKIIRFIKSFF